MGNLRETAGGGGGGGSGSGGGVCMMSKKWRDEQNLSFVQYISTFLASNSFRLVFVPISPDFIFNCGGLSVAFVFITHWEHNNASSIFTRVQKLKSQFANLYVIVSLPTNLDNESFVRSYFNFEFEIGKPPFVPVLDLEMGFEKIVKIAHSRGACKRQDLVSKFKAERIRSMQSMDAFLRVVTSIPGIDNHDANMLSHAIGSIEAIAKASTEYIVENTDLSTDKAELITKFFRDPKVFLSPKLN